MESAPRTRPPIHVKCISESYSRRWRTRCSFWRDRSGGQRNLPCPRSSGGCRHFPRPTRWRFPLAWPSVVRRPPSGSLSCRAAHSVARRSSERLVWVGIGRGISWLGWWKVREPFPVLEVCRYLHSHGGCFARVFWQPVNGRGWRRHYTVQFPQQLATQHWKMFLLQLPRWGVTPCNAPEQLATICAEKAWRNSLLARRGRWSVGLTKNERTLGENCVASCWRGVTLCNGSCKLLRLLRKVELDSTSCNTLRATKKDALQVAEVPCYTAQLFSNLQRNDVALQVAVKIAQCNRALKA